MAPQWPPAAVRLPPAAPSSLKPTGVYGPAQALFGIDLQMQAGQMVVLQGLNGAGKSTLLKSVMGLEVSTLGQVLLRSVQGQMLDVGQWSSHRRARAGLGYVAEDRRLFASLTVRDNLRVAGGARCADRMAWVLDRFALLKPMIDRRAGLMSGGEQQMLAVARSLMTEPRLLLLDEPCSNLDAAGIEQYHQFMQQWLGNRLLIVASNDADEYRMCSEHISMQQLKPVSYDSSK
jgi:branched-chain amino acid transport system ATP-binding protein